MIDVESCVKIIIGTKTDCTQNKIIVCKKRNISHREAISIIKKAFPNLVSVYSGQIPFYTEHSYEMYSSKFDCQIECLRQEVNWRNAEYVAMEIFKENEHSYCLATPIYLGG